MQHTFSGFCRNMSATVSPMVALTTLLSLTKPSVIYSIWCKKKSFEAERKDLLDNKFVKRSSRSAPHSPFICPNGLIRSSGHIKRLIEIGFNVNYPIILDARHPFVKLFLEHTHVKNYHQGVEYLRSIVQEHYTVLKLRSSLRSIKAHCLRCREFQAVTMQPIMSDLPKERLAYQSPPFTNTGVEYIGRDNAKFYPEAAKAVFENFCMDDYKAINRSKELVHLLHLGGFKLTKFVSNVPNLADRIVGSSQSTEPKVIVSCQEDSSHVLGLKWDHTNDTLVVSRGTSCAITKSLTQRLVLSLVSKVFDPIGLVASFTVGARLLLKDIWRVTRQQWDDELLQDIFQRFLVWSADLPKLENIKIPRSYFSGPFDNIELHMFGDSSQDIFGAIAFLRARVKTPTDEEKQSLRLF